MTYLDYLTLFNYISNISEVYSEYELNGGRTAWFKVVVYFISVPTLM